MSLIFVFRGEIVIKIWFLKFCTELFGILKSMMYRGGGSCILNVRDSWIFWGVVC